MAVATMLGWWLGTKGDAHFGTDPWLMLVGLLFGVAAGFRGLIRAAKRLQGEHADADAGPNVDPNVDKDGQGDS